MHIKIKIDNISSSDMKIDLESKVKAIELISELKDKNINIILEAYPWIADGEKSETEWKPDNINIFFSNWRANVLKKLIDDIAVPYNVDVLKNLCKEEKNLQRLE